MDCTWLAKPQAVLGAAVLGLLAAASLVRGPTCLPMAPIDILPFEPSPPGRSLFVPHGRPVTLVNLGTLATHHPYVRTDGFSFDGGDLEPGGRLRLTFPHPGSFFVLCGIHPRLRLLVSAR